MRPIFCTEICHWVEFTIISWFVVEMAASTKELLYRVPNQHEYDGVQFGTYFQPHVLDRVKTFKVTEDDILIVGFPKSG